MQFLVQSFGWAECYIKDGIVYVHRSIRSGMEMPVLQPLKSILQETCHWQLKYKEMKNVCMMGGVGVSEQYALFPVCPGEIDHVCSRINTGTIPVVQPV